MRDFFTPVFLLALAALFLADGSGAAPFAARPLALLAFALFLALFLLKKYRAAYLAIAACAALLLAGSFLGAKSDFVAGPGFAVAPGDYVTISGRLRAFPEIGNGRSLLLVGASAFSWPGHRLERELNVRVVVSGDCRDFNRGDRIEIAARLDPRQANRNFFPNPYENYLLYENIRLTAYSKSAQLARVLRRGNLFWRAIGAWRGRVRRAIEERYLKDGALQPPGVFLEATLLGDRGRLENGEQEVLIGSGVFHLLAISGGNIAILAMVALLLCRWLRFPLRLRYAVTALLLLLFLALSGFDISAERAVLMALLVFAGRVWFLEVEPANIISFCGLLLLAFNPAQFLDPGFALTFALTAAILAGRRLLLPALRFLPRWAAELFSANLSAALMALPLSLYYFQRYAFSGFFSGLLLAPLAAAITVCGVVLLLLAWLPTAVASLALLPAGICLDAFFAASRWIYDHAALGIFRPSPPLWLLGVIGASFFVVSRPWLKWRARAAAALLLAALLGYISLPPSPYRPGRLEVYFLDVGHGDAALAVFANGDALLVDGGGASFSDFQVGRRLVLPFLLQQRVRVRWAAATHFHPDHAKGLAEIMAILKPEELWLASAAKDDDHYRRLLAARPKKTRLREIGRGFVMHGGAASIACLSPREFIRASMSANDHSMVLRVADGRFSVLLPGDIEKESEYDLVDETAPALAASVLKLPHHGSRTSSSAPFLDAVRPRLAVISLAAESAYGFPHQEVIDRLKARGIRWLTTARSGGIMIAAAPEGLEIEVSK